MPLFKCSQCGHIDNTAMTNYWRRVHDDKLPGLCSLCDPEIGKWHGKFARFKPEDRGLVQAPDDFFYDPKDRVYLERIAGKKS